MGALNAITHEIITVTNDSYITGTQVCELLKKLADLKLTIPITLVLDNARYQKCNSLLSLWDNLTNLRHFSQRKIKALTDFDKREILA